MENEGKYYTPEQEVFSEAKCEKIAKSQLKDAYGNRHPFPDRFQDSSAVYGYGKRRFNGGVIYEGQWWEGTNIPYPKLAEGYVYAIRRSWGIYIMTRKDAEAENLEILENLS
jgi:hypothetical protein